MNTNSTANTLDKSPCAEKKYVITRRDLPLSCPLPPYRLWDAHPRVYLPIEETGKETCPYCGAIYVLETHGTTSHE